MLTTKEEKQLVTQARKTWVSFEIKRKNNIPTNVIAIDLLQYSNDNTILNMLVDSIESQYIHWVVIATPNKSKHSLDDYHSLVVYIPKVEFETFQRFIEQTI